MCNQQSPPLVLQSYLVSLCFVCMVLFFFLPKNAIDLRSKCNRLISTIQEVLIQSRFVSRFSIKTYYINMSEHFSSFAMEFYRITLIIRDSMN